MLRAVRRTATTAAARTAAAPQISAVARQAVRFGHSAPVGYGSGPYRGLKIPKVAAWHKNLSTVYGTILWLWIFYRAKCDGPALLGLEHPWDHGGHGHDDHDDHGHDGDKEH